MGPSMEHEEHLEALERAIAAFGDRAAAADPDAAVASCPGWTVSKLVAHLGDVARWATAAVVDGIDAERPFTPGSEEVLADWYREGAAALLDALRRTPVEQDVWSFGPPPHRVTFWSRRQLHETTIHLWDLESTAGAPSPIAERVARDGIDEVCSMFYPRQVRLGRMERLRHTLGLDAGSEQWVLGPSDQPEVVLRGRASDLVLVLWKRLPLDDAPVEIVGDRSIARAVLAQRITP